MTREQSQVADGLLSFTVIRPASDLSPINSLDSVDTPQRRYKLRATPY